MCEPLCSSDHAGEVENVRLMKIKTKYNLRSTKIYNNVKQILFLVKTLVQLVNRAKHA